MNAQSLNVPFIECETMLVFVSVDIKIVAFRYATVIINIAIALFGSMANSLVIIAYYRNRRLRTIQNTAFLLLAVTDIGVTAVVEPVYVAANLSALLADPSCSLWNANTLLSKLFLQLSLVTIVILSLQSYITLAYPYRWQIIITRLRFNSTVIASWLLVLFLTFSAFFHPTILTYVPPCVLSSAIVTVVLTWCWTAKLVARHRKAIRTDQTPSTGEDNSRRKILRSTVTAFAVISSLLACYLLTLCFVFLRKFLSPWKIGYDTYVALWLVSVSLMYLNSLLNPCLLFWRSTPFRETAKRILHL